MDNHDLYQYLLHDVLKSLQDHSSRKMFGGYCLYYRKKPWGIIIEEELWLKADRVLGEYFLQQGSEQFCYDRNGKTICMCYYKVPADVMSLESTLKPWIEKAIFGTMHQPTSIKK